MSGFSLARRRFRIIAGVTALALTVSGCAVLDGTSAAPTAPGAVEHSPLKIGILATVDNAPVRLAEKRGFFRDAGLSVDIKVFQSGPEALGAVSGGSLDVCLINYVSFFQAVSRGTVDGRVIADAYQGTESSLVLMAKPDSGIKEPRDLAGKTVSIHAPGNINELLVRALLQANGVDPGAPRYAPVKFPDIQAALESNQIQAGVLVEPYITQAAQKLGAKPVLPLVTGPTADIPLSGYVALAKFTEANPRTVAAFQRAMRSANELADTDRRALAEVLPDLTVLPDKTKLPAEDVASLSLGKFPTSVDATRLRRVVDLMRTYGGLNADIDVTKYVVAPAG
jgi:NitT/TauT family transport system substrate-binding protein